MGNVNLDALIKRQDFDAIQESPSSSSYQALSQTVAITELAPGKFLFLALRKPDFQRETSNWTPEKVADLVETLVRGDLVPAIILWKSPTSGEVFVIDGSHRLSALIAWVHDDYGDRTISTNFFENFITEDQKKMAEKTRKLIKKRVGSYQEIQAAALNEANSKPEHVQLAKQLSTLAFQVQWVIGDASKAEQSFFKINRQGTAIHPTEYNILQSRSHANALAARAIMRGGTGHKYWGKFNDAVKTDIVKEAKQIHDNLFIPHYNTPIKTVDLPVAGRSYSADTLPLVFDFVNLANDLLTGRNIKVLHLDEDGTDTLTYLKTVRKLAFRISGIHASSLGLHPAVYFYGINGRYQPTTFYAMVALIKELEKQSDGFDKFTKVRRAFEDYLLKRKDFTNQIAGKIGSGLKGYLHVVRLYKIIIEELTNGLAEGEIVGKVRADPKLAFLSTTPDYYEKQGKDFTTDGKSEVFLKQALENLNVCKICNAYIHINSITTDHIVRKGDGGIGLVNNGQIAHPYCNTTFKN